MDFLSFDRFAERIKRYDDLAGQTLGIDTFCSSSDWIIPANEALMPSREPWILESDHAFVAMARGIHEDGWSYLQPLESMWLLGSPCVVSEPDVGAKEVAKSLVADGAWDVLMLAGMSMNSPLLQGLVRHMESRFRFYMGPVTRRYVADLRGGVEDYLGRRSRNFRKGLRRSIRRCEDAGIEFEVCDSIEPAALAKCFDRLMAIESRSWKGRMGEGVNDGPMRDFYARMLPRLRGREALRLRIARVDGRDVGFILGGTMGTTYRGLQFSFDDEFEPLSLGNYMQWTQLTALIDEGITDYDLGTEVDYKRRWAELGLETVMLTVAPF